MNQSREGLMLTINFSTKKLLFEKLGDGHCEFCMTCWTQKKTQTTIYDLRVNLILRTDKCFPHQHVNNFPGPNILHLFPSVKYRFSRHLNFFMDNKKSYEVGKLYVVSNILSVIRFLGDPKKIHSCKRKENLFTNGNFYTFFML